MERHAVHLKAQFFDEIALVIADVIVVRFIVVFRPVHRDIRRLVVFRAEPHSWLQCLPPPWTRDDIMAGHALPPTACHRLACEVRLSACRALWTVITNLPWIPCLSSRHFSDVPADIHFAICHDLRARRIFRNRHLEISGQLQGFISTHSRNIRDQLYGVYWETIFWQNIAAYKKAN